MEERTDAISRIARPIGAKLNEKKQTSHIFEEKMT